MSFLQKFKGKTSLLKKEEVGKVLGEKSSTLLNKSKNNQMHLLKLAQTSGYSQKQSSISDSNLNIKNTNLSSQNLKRSNVKNKLQNPEITSQTKKQTENPFLIQNEFFLDEEQHQQVLKRRNEEEIRIKIQRQRKKKQQLHEQMLTSMRNSTLKNQKQTKKQWIKLGGLGPNIGGEQWSKKKSLQQKMMKFAQEIKKINTVKLQNSQNVSLRAKQLWTERLKQKEIDSRTIGIKYSKKIQKPTFYSLEKTRQDNNIRQSHSDTYGQMFPTVMRKSLQMSQTMMDSMENQFNGLKLERRYSELQRLQNRHKEFKNLVYGNKI